MNSSPGTSAGHSLPQTVRIPSVVLAIGWPKGTNPAAPTEARSHVVDHTVVSVGPYMFINTPGTSSRSCRARSSGSASPPTRSADRRDSALRPAESATSMLAMEGVHCRCVADWSTMSSATDARTDETVPLDASMRRFKSGRCSSTSSGAIPKSIRQAISSTPADLIWATRFRQCSGVPNKALVP